MLPGTVITLEATGSYTDSEGVQRQAISATVKIVVMSSLPVKRPVFLSYFDPKACGIPVVFMQNRRIVRGVLLQDGGVFVSYEYTARPQWPQRPRKSIWAKPYDPLASYLGYTL